MPKSESAAKASFNTIKSITYLVEGSPYTKAIAFYGFARGIAEERGYMIELADSTIFLRESLLKMSKSCGAEMVLIPNEALDEEGKEGDTHEDP